MLCVAVRAMATVKSYTTNASCGDEVAGHVAHRAAGAKLRRQPMAGRDLHGMAPTRCASHVVRGALSNWEHSLRGLPRRLPAGCGWPTNVSPAATLLVALRRLMR